MTEKQLIELLNDLVKLPSENEWVEFKPNKGTISNEEIGEYISAMSNGATIKNKHYGFLIWGVEDSNHKIIGTNFTFTKAKQGNQDLELWLRNLLSPSINFEIYEFYTNKHKIVLIRIPSAKGEPTYFKKIPYIRIGSNKTDLRNFQEYIRMIYNSLEDWTKVIVSDATIDDLDSEAIKKARIEFVKRNPKYENEASNWDDAKFLNKAKITIKSKITRTALILLGKEESEHFLGSTVKIRWNLKTIDNQDKDFEIFSIPLILAVDNVYKKIRNLKYRYLRDGTLFPDEFLRYDPFTIREPLNNAIAHQDYSKGARINVVEIEDDQLIYSNYGTFIPGSVENVILHDSPEERYRNPFLVEAMKNLDLIETQGGGIRKIFNFQRERFFPLPDYDFANGKVKVTVTGKILDEDFARILIQNKSLTLEDILLLDKVQKKKKLSSEEFNYLKKQKLIEGRINSAYLSFNVIKRIDDDALKAEYLANRSLDDSHFREMIVEYLKRFGKAKRRTLNNFIVPKLSDALSLKQKIKKVDNYLSFLRKANQIESNEKKEWFLKN
ncbi:MAG: transcriptional regulator [Ignavibacteriales bacterium CG18_big_fil_WC_8_21_14_2_50_31_20]|nr:MAG: transcriptional regulator [Ignavibacteriales bacterium CG18_big_fil_WC_8_21_14_2_50_31_20]